MNLFFKKSLQKQVIENLQKKISQKKAAQDDKEPQVKQGEPQSQGQNEYDQLHSFKIYYQNITNYHVDLIMQTKKSFVNESQVKKQSTRQNKDNSQMMFLDQQNYQINLLDLVKEQEKDQSELSNSFSLDYINDKLYIKSKFEQKLNKKIQLIPNDTRNQQRSKSISVNINCEDQLDNSTESVHQQNQSQDNIQVDTINSIDKTNEDSKINNTQLDDDLKDTKSSNHNERFDTNQSGSFKVSQQVIKQIDQKGRKQINQYIVIKDLGRGAHGKVKLCLDQAGIQYAIKINKKTNIKIKMKTTNSDTYTLMQREIAILKKLDHKFIVKLFEVIDDPTENKIYMVMEYVKKGAILSTEYFKEEKEQEKLLQLQPVKHVSQSPVPNVISFNKARKYFRQIALALDYLHNIQHLVHRDIKPDNILVDENDNIKLSDFATSHIFQKDDQFLTSSEGTQVYFAPEIWINKKFKGYPIDVYATGISLYKCMFGCLPFKAKEIGQLKEQILNSKIQIPNSLTDPLIIDFLNRCLDKNPESRITAAEMLKHPWLTENGNLQLVNSNAQKITLSNEDILKALTTNHIQLKAFFRIAMFVQKKKQQQQNRISVLQVNKYKPLSNFARSSYAQY